MNGLTRGSFMMNINRKESGVSQLFALISISEMCVLIHSKCTCMYPVKRGSLDSVHVYGSQQLPQLFVGMESENRLKRMVLR